VLGHPIVRTPNLDALAGDGVLFTQAYCASVPCGPARASIFTGRYPDAHGVTGNRRHIHPDIPVLPECLRDAGYDTALVGVLHLHPFERRYGFNHFMRHDAPYTNFFPEEAYDSAYVRYLQQTLFKDDPEKPIRLFTEDEACLETDELRYMLGSNFIDEEHHVTTWTARETITYLREKRREPFFLNCSFFGPHQPYLCPGTWETLYNPAKVPLPDDFFVNTADKPLFTHSPLQDLAERRKRQGWDKARYRRVLSAYYGNIAMIDHALGCIFNTLKKEGLWDNTLIIFTADHGDYGGQFKSFYKGLPYEGSIHIPMIIRDPRERFQGRTENANVNSIDLFATCLAAAGVAPPKGCESRDLGNLSAGKRNDWVNRTFWKKGTCSALVRDGFKLMRDTIEGEIVYEFYDLSKRPIDAQNEIHAPQAAERVEQMKSELNTWHDGQQAIASPRAEVK